MLSLFRTNQLLFSLLLIFYAAVLHVAAFITETDWQPRSYGILSAWLYDWLPHHTPLAHSAVLLLLVIQATALNAIAATHRFSDTITLFPGLFFILIASAIPEFLQLSPLHFANTALLIAISEMMKIYKKSACADNIFNVGFWVAVGSLFYPSYLIFVPLGLIGLNNLRAFNLRESLILLSGVVVPYLLTGTFAFWTDQFGWLMDLQVMQAFALFGFLPVQDVVEAYFKIAFVDLFLLTAILSYGAYLYKKNIQVQKKIGLLYWVLLLGGLTLTIQAGIQLDHMLILAIPLGIMMALSFLNIRPHWAETLHFFILLVVFFFQYRQFILPE